MKTLAQVLCVLFLFSTLTHAGMDNREHISLTIINKSSSTLMVDLGMSECTGIIDEGLHNVRPGESVTSKAHKDSRQNTAFEWLFYFLAAGSDEIGLMVYATDDFINSAPDEKRFVVTQRETHTDDTTFVRIEIRDKPKA